MKVVEVNRGMRMGYGPMVLMLNFILRFVLLKEFKFICAYFFTFKR
jgi:hypothetical protein